MPRVAGDGYRSGRLATPTLRVATWCASCLTWTCGARWATPSPGITATPDSGRHEGLDRDIVVGGQHHPRL